ncbi:S-layer homology domain-containing protein [Cohnella endophytica]|uniref:S-layer homology domain-containing protein n=1 Tax=Cohnella endophytica TaxID=2419778 RepID=UPI0013146B26|nr:S-layer homology domain-containing protein [Cohnella endophytica]
MKGLLRKISALTAFTILGIMLFPLFASAATMIQTTYNHDAKKLYTSVYSTDPSKVKVEYKDQNGLLHQMSSSNTDSSTDIVGYDDANVPYYSKNYQVDLNVAPECVKATDGNTVYVPKKEYSENPWGKFTTYDYSNVNLDAYRISGEQYFTEDQMGYYLNPGDDLFSFTPKISNNETFDAIQVEFPYDYIQGIETEVDFENINADDFVLEDVTDGKTVLIDDLIRYSEGYNNVLIIKFADELVDGHEYKLSLSEDSMNDSLIYLPDASGLAANVYAGKYIEGNYEINGEIYSYHFVDGYNLARFADVPNTQGSVPLAENGETTGWGELEQPGSCVQTYTSPITTTPTDTTPPVSKDNQVISEKDLKNSQNGKVKVELENGKKEVTLPANVTTALGDNKLEVRNDKISIEIPTDVLKQLEGLVTPEELKNASISFKFDQVSQEDAGKLIKNKDGITLAGDIYEFQISITTKDGKESKLSSFNKPISIKLKVNNNTDKNLLGIYYISDSGQFEYVGGEVVGGEIVANIQHFSKYGVLEYNKIYVDVPSSHWANQAIKILSAKHIISGVSTTEFAPSRNTTRAEFVSLLVNALNLKASGKAAFTDVDSSKSYASAVAAAYEAGIVRGKSENLFAPDALISREEMAVMITKAFEIKSGKKAGEAAQSSFTDNAQISSWAKSYVNVAAELDLMKGSGGKFSPRNNVTRAECAQIILNFITK